MTYCVGQKAIKMSFIQTSPGKEKEVAAQIEEKSRDLKKEGKITDFHVMLGLGGFDVILIYETYDFEAYTTQQGAVTGINKISRCYCFQQEIDESQRTLFEALRQNPFAGIRLYKLNPTKNDSVLKTERDFFDDYVDHKSHLETFFFGTLGWNEIVVIVVGKNIDEIAKEVFWVSRPEQALQLYKTQSYICLDINQKFPPLPKKAASRIRVKSKICISKLAVKPIAYVSVIPPCCNEVYHWWNQFQEVLVVEILGRDDLVITPTEEMDLLTFIGCMISFRESFIEKILSTNTVITFSPDVPKSTKISQAPSSDNKYHEYLVRLEEVSSWEELVGLIVRESSSDSRTLSIFDDQFKLEMSKGRITQKRKKEILCRLNSFIATPKTLNIPSSSTIWNRLRYSTLDILNSAKIQMDPYARVQVRRMIVEDLYSITVKASHIIYYDFPVIVKQFDITASIKYASVINSLNGMVQSRLLKESFFDMMPYASTVLARCNFEEKEANIAKLYHLIDLLKGGAEIRSYGAHGTIEDITGQFTRMRGGIQRFLLAAEFIAHKCFLTCSRQMWEGFIVVDAERFSEYEEIISLPMDCLWKVEKIWPIYHEISHTLVNMVNLVDYRLPEIARFMIRKTRKDDWLTMLNEFAADILTFQICFFNDFPHYKECFCVEYIESSPRNETKDIIALLLRLYIVNVFFNIFIEEITDIHFFEDEDNAYSDIVKFLDTVDPSIISRLPETRNKFFLAAEYQYLVKQLWPWLQLVYIKCAEFNLIDTYMVGLRNLSSPMDIALQIKNDYDSSLARHINRKIKVFKEEFNSFSSSDIPVSDFVIEILDIINKLIKDPTIIIEEKLYLNNKIPKKVQRDLLKASSSGDLSQAARRLFEAFFGGAIEGYLPAANKLMCVNTKEAIESIENGYAFPRSVEHPEALIYHFSKNKKSNFSRNIAMMLTFSNCYNTDMAKGMAEL